MPAGRVIREETGGFGTIGPGIVQKRIPAPLTARPLSGRKGPGDAARMVGAGLWQGEFIGPWAWRWRKPQGAPLRKPRSVNQPGRRRFQDDCKGPSVASNPDSHSDITPAPVAESRTVGYAARGSHSGTVHPSLTLVARMMQGCGPFARVGARVTAVISPPGYKNRGFLVAPI